MNGDNGVAVGAASLIAWPLIASAVAAALRLERGQRRAVAFCVAAGALALGVGLSLDLQAVASGEASVVGSFLTSCTVAFTPPAIAAALAPRSTGAAKAGRWPGLGRRAFAAYGALCLSTPVALVLGFFVGAYTCQGGCL